MTIYVALLRGINVGGNNKIDMKKLKAAFESVAMTDVTTYINSGNVIFRSTKKKATVQSILEKTITKEFGLTIPVLLKTMQEIKAILKHIPKNYTNDAQFKTDVLFLWDDVDYKAVKDQLLIKPVDTVQVYSDFVLWHLNKEDRTKSGQVKLVGKSIYAKMTIRNVTTVRKIYALMEAL